MHLEHLHAAVRGRARPKMAAVARPSSLRVEAGVRDLVCLGKPAITASNVLMAAGGMLLAPQRPVPATVATFLIGTALVVAAANGANMIIERESDALMARTRRRPLAAGRLSPWKAGLATGLAAITGLGLLAAVEPLTAALGGAALLLYAAAYTPLKRRTPWSLYVGAIPGAVPPVMGWTAAEGSLSWVALACFALLYAWQIPHFLGIAAWRRDDYAAAGIRTIVSCFGEGTARRHALLGAGALLIACGALVALHAGGWIFFAAATTTSAMTLKACLDRDLGWSRRAFVASVWFLPVVVVALALERMAGI